MVRPHRRPAAVLAVLAAVLVVPSVAAPAPPQEGVFVPGRSLGGVRLGMTPAQVRAAWGTMFGRCRNCHVPTWYYTYAPFAPEGAGVEFRRGRVTAVFTLWSPRGWRTTRGLRLGDPEARIAALYGPLDRAECDSYHALLRPRGRVVSAFYVADGRVWGFALLMRPSPPCR